MQDFEILVKYSFRYKKKSPVCFSLKYLLAFAKNNLFTKNLSGNSISKSLSSHTANYRGDFSFPRVALSHTFSNKTIFAIKFFSKRLRKMV